MSHLKVLDYRIPEGRYADIVGVGRIHYRDSGDSSKVHTVLLIHGMMATGATNWLPCFEPMSRHFRVVAPDLRGHGQSLPDCDAFELGHCADDIALLLQHLQIGPVIAVGYSMGGGVAQQLWIRHRDKVEGLVFTATGAGGHLSALANRPAKVIDSLIDIARGRRRRARRRPSAELPRDTIAEADKKTSQWVMGEMMGQKLATVLQATREMINHDFNHWLEHVDVPTAVLVTVKDRLFSLDHQSHMVRHIPGARALHFSGGHVSSSLSKDYARALVTTCMDVASRVERTTAPASGGSAGPTSKNAE